MFREDGPIGTDLAYMRRVDVRESLYGSEEPTGTQLLKTAVLVGLIEVCGYSIFATDPYP